MEFALRRRCEILGLPWLITSAGTRARPGLNPHPYAERLLRSHGDDSEGWHSRRVTVDLLASADIILTASAEHRNEVLWLYPQAARRAFVFLQLARCCGLSKNSLMGRDGSTQAVEAQLVLARDLVPRPSAQDDLDDPIGRSYRRYRRTDQRIEAAADQLLTRPDAQASGTSL